MRAGSARSATNTSSPLLFREMADSTAIVLSAGSMTGNTTPYESTAMSSRAVVRLKTVSVGGGWTFGSVMSR